MIEVGKIRVEGCHSIRRLPCKGMARVVNKENIFLKARFDRSSNSRLDRCLGSLFICQNDAILGNESMLPKRFEQPLSIPIGERHTLK